jgi:hypothetical protein
MRKGGWGLVTRDHARDVVSGGAGRLSNVYDALMAGAVA